MMAEYRITPIQVGSLWLYRGAFTSKPDEYRQEEEFPILIFLLEGNGRKILVDTGGGDPESESMKSAGHAKSRHTPDQTPDQALRLLGVSPDEMYTVILTHLHWDHAYNNHLFPRARFVVQKAELLEAVDPLPKFRGFYESFSSGRIPPWARQATDWIIVDGACILCERIRLIPLPGHTAGLQGVLVDTADGRKLIASDAVPLYECIEKLDQRAYAISSLCTDLKAFYESYDRLRKLQESGVSILASHDFLTLSDAAVSATRAETAAILYRLAAFRQNGQIPSTPEQNESEEQNMSTLTIEIGGQTFTATLQDTPATRALLEHFPMTVTMNELNGNEKYCYLSENLPVSSERPEQIRTGDLMLYGSNCLVLFYEDFSTSYSYTRLGRIDDPAGLKRALGGSSAEVTFRISE